MHADLTSFGNGWYGLRLALRPSEIGRVVALLQQLERNPEQHFHLSSDFSGDGGVGDIEISVAAEGEPDNLFVSGLAIPPDSDTSAHQE